MLQAAAAVAQGKNSCISNNLWCMQRPFNKDRFTRLRSLARAQKRCAGERQALLGAAGLYHTVYGKTMVANGFCPFQ
jgi:hypothetical protein